MNGDYRRFWRELATLLPRMSRVLDGADDILLPDEITALVQEHAGDLNWEFGPDGRSMMFCFAIAAKVGLLPITEAIISQAPTVKGWRFHASKPPRQVPPLIQFPAGGRTNTIAVTGWRFAFHGSDRAGRCDVLVLPGQCREKIPEKAELAALLLVEMALGEREFATGIRDVILVPSDDEVATRIHASQPLKHLPRAYAKRKATKIS